MGHLTRWGRKLDRLFERVEREFQEMEAAFEREFVVVGDTLEKVIPARPHFKVEKQPNLTTIRVEVPGCGPEEVKVTLAEGVVTVEARTQEMGLASRFRVGPKVEPSDITATVKHGILTLVIQRDQQASAPSGTVKVTG